MKVLTFTGTKIKLLKKIVSWASLRPLCATNVHSILDKRIHSKIQILTKQTIHSVYFTFIPIQDTKYTNLSLYLGVIPSF